MRLSSWWRAAASAAASLQQLPWLARFFAATCSFVPLALGFVVLYPRLDVAAGALNALPAIAFGWLLGARGALYYGLLAVPLNALLLAWVGDARTPLLTHVIGNAAFMLVAAGMGWGRDLHLRLQRQAEALRSESKRLEREIELRIRAEARLKHQALHDPLTDLPNRRLFLDRLQHAYEHSKRRTGEAWAVLYLDLDDFKQVNDTLGHDAGDRLLRTVAERLQASVRSADTVARIGGDEFAILLEAAAAPRNVDAVVERIQANLAAASGAGPAFRASIGVVNGIAGYPDIDAILRDADRAMYIAKARGGDASVVVGRATREMPAAGPPAAR